MVSIHHLLPKIAIPNNSNNLKTTIENYVNTLSNSTLWNATISDYVKGETNGSLRYKVTLSKTDYESKVIDVSYGNGTFLTLIEIEQNIINSISPDTIKSNDGITPPTSPKNKTSCN